MKVQTPLLISSVLLSSVIFSQTAVAGGFNYERELHNQGTFILKVAIRDSLIKRSKTTRTDLKLAGSSSKYERRRLIKQRGSSNRSSGSSGSNRGNSKSYWKKKRS